VLQVRDQPVVGQVGLGSRRSARPSCRSATDR